jgi:hypothetical protein
MVSTLSLIVLAVLLAVSAALVAWSRGLTAAAAAKDATAALLATQAAMIAACGLYAASAPHPGSLALLASPLAATLALRLRGRRSIPRALFVSATAVIAVVVWLTLHLRGARGNWTIPEVAVTTVAAAVAVGSAACLGWWSKRPRGSASAAAGLILLAVCASACAGDPPQRGALELTLRDTSTGRPTSARVELLAEDGTSVIPDAALPIFDDCGRVPVHNWVPATARVQVLRHMHRDIPNPYTATDQFYADGTISIRLRPGRYRVAAMKGIEFRVARVDVAVAEGQTQSVVLDLVRWVDLPGEGWYGADDHLHIPRPAPRFDRHIATWMQAEDIHVANLLQMGLARDVHVTPQCSFGERSVRRTGNTLLVSGQENPRTHVLGHSIVLGAREWIDFPDSYLRYDRFWSMAHDLGAVNGYAHWALAGAEEGLAVWGHLGLLDFIEVLNLGFPRYERWYEALNLGIRIGPTAGTDYPCLPSLPGRERFYARVDGDLEYDAWLEAVRCARTFVTNGPVVDLAVDGAGPGDDLRLPGPATVRITGRVRFDPERDQVTRLELIGAGKVVRLVEEPGTPGQLNLESEVDVRESTWFALRAVGEKRGETPIDARGVLRGMLVLARRTNDALIETIPEGRVPRISAAHTAAVWVTVEGTPPVSRQPRAREVVRAWLDRLDELRDRFDNERIDDLAGFPGRGDGIGSAELREGREALLQAIEDARRYYGDPRLAPAAQDRAGIVPASPVCGTPTVPQAR